MGWGGEKETIRIYLKLLATSTDRIHENVMKRNYNWFFSSPSTTTTTPGLRCNKRKKYEKWSCGMRWYLWRIIHMAAADASTMNSYKRIYVRSEMENFSLQLEIDCPSAHQEIFHLFPRNTSSSSFSCLSPRLSWPLIRLRVSCDATFISCAMESHMFRYERGETERESYGGSLCMKMCWKIENCRKHESCNFDVHTLLIKAFAFIIRGGNGEKHAQGLAANIKGQVRRSGLSFDCAINGN